MKNSILRALTVAAVVFAFAAFAWAQSTTPAPAGHPGHGGGMMAGHQAKMADMAASEKKLDEMIAQMNAATGQAKVDQMAAIINEMVAQHKRMHGMMMGRGAAAAAAPAAPAAPAPGHQNHHE